MKTKQKLAIFGWALALAAGGAAVPAAAPSQAGPHQPAVIRCPEETASLARRWEWARQAVRENRDLGSGYWIGYAVEKLMEENAFIGCFLGSGAGETSLATLLRGEKALVPSRLRSHSFFIGGRPFSGREGNDRMGKWVKKRIGLLYRFGKGGEGLPETVGAVDEAWPVAFEEKPLIWLGPATEDESLALLAGLYDRPAAGKLAERIVTVAGIHEASGPVLAFLQRVAKSRAPEPVRLEAVSGLAGYRDARALQTLLPLARTEASIKVRKESISALGDIGGSQAVDALIEIARSKDPEEVREEAIQALTENASDKVIAVLDRIISSDQDQNVQEEAVQALAEMDGGAGLPLLIKTAKTHRVFEIRKTAVEALGESTDPRALETLIELAKSKGVRYF